MSREQVRIAVANTVVSMQAAWKAAKGVDLVVETDNRKMVDQATQEKPYLQVQIRYMAAEQADMADNPFIRTDGQILLAVVAKENSGTSEANELIDFVRPYFELKNIGPAQCKAVEDKSAVPKNGWYYSPAIVNFWYHRLSA